MLTSLDSKKWKWKIICSDENVIKAHANLRIEEDL